MNITYCWIDRGRALILECMSAEINLHREQAIFLQQISISRVEIVERRKQLSQLLDYFLNMFAVEQFQLDQNVRS